jgi:DNA polymerase-3 subunit gamma/tau
MSDSLITKYRPDSFEQVLGQDAAAASLQKIIEADSSHSFIFHGPSGTGKTTLARIVAAQLGCDKNAIIEVDAATHSGVEAVRGIVDMMNYAPLGASTNKACLIDEAHALSKAAWQALLKAIEEPAKFAYWFLCTTELEKIPVTIRTRCATYQLKEVPNKDLFALLQFVRDEEGYECPDEVLDIIASASNGSPRQALAQLAVCAFAKDRKQAATLIRSAEGSTETIELCRALARGGYGWDQLIKIVKGLEETNPESIRYQVVAYFTKVAMDAKQPEAAVRALEVLQAFGTPYPNANTLYPVLLSLGELVFSE